MTKRKTVVTTSNSKALVGGLEELESVIAASGSAVLDAGRALRRIRDERLYQGGGEGAWDTFDAYCRARWDMIRENADRMIRNADVADTLIAEGRDLPRSAQALTVMYPVLRTDGAPGVLEVWDRACDFMGGAKHVNVAALEELIKGSPKSRGDVVDGTSEVISEEPGESVVVPGDGEVDSAPPATDEEWEERIREAVDEIEAGGVSGTEDVAAEEVPDSVTGLDRLMRALAVLSDAAKVVASAADEVVVSGELEELGGAESAEGALLNELLSSVSDLVETALDGVTDLVDGAEGLPVPSGAVDEDEIELGDDGFPVPVTFSG